MEEAHERGDFAVTIIRPAATHQDDSWPIPLLGSGRGVVERIRLGLPILVPGDGTAFWVSAHREGRPLSQTEAQEPDPAMELYGKVVEGFDKAGQFCLIFW